jgi:sugar lactone lactonase YvrE
MTIRAALLLSTLLALAGCGQQAQPSQTEQPKPAAAQFDPRVEEFASLDKVVNAVTTTRDGRVFVSLPQVEGPGGPQVAELKDGQLVPYPNLEWSQWTEGADPLRTLLHVNTVRIGPEGDLWVVDAGAPRVGGKASPGAAKIIRIDLSTNTIRRTYQADPSVVRDYSYFNDIRFNGNLAYITDAAAMKPAIVVLDLTTGRMRRVLEDHPLLVASKAMYADGGRLIVLKDPIPDSTGQMTDRKLVNVDQLEVTPDGRWLYFQPIGGPLARAPTRLIDEPAVPPAQLAAAVEKVVDTWTAAGSAIDATGNIYLSQVETRSVMRISPDNQVTTLVSDPRLTWVDAMWVDAQGYLYMPAAQLDRTSQNLKGAPAQIEYPIRVLRMRIGAGPSPLDHR